MWIVKCDNERMDPCDYSSCSEFWHDEGRFDNRNEAKVFRDFLIHIEGARTARLVKLVPKKDDYNESIILTFSGNDGQCATYTVLDKALVAKIKMVVGVK